MRQSGDLKMAERTELTLVTDLSRGLTDLGRVDAAEKKLAAGFDDLATRITRAEQALGRFGGRSAALGSRVTAGPAAQTDNAVLAKFNASARSLAEIESAGKRATQSLGATTEALNQSSNSGRLFGLSITAGVTAALFSVEQFASKSIKAFNELRAAQLGVQAEARFRGIDETVVTETIRNLDLVKGGLLDVGAASTSVRNLLASGFNLQQSIELVNRFGDSAAFGRQQSLSLSEAVRSATEGVKNQNSILVDNAGVTKNLSVILAERGFQLQDISDKVKGAAAREALYNGLLVETQGQVGNASKLSKEFAGQQARLDATWQRLLQTTGEAIAKNPQFNKSLQDLIESLGNITRELGDSNSELRKFVDDSVSDFGRLARAIASVIEPAVQLGAFLKRASDIFNPVRDILIGLDNLGGSLFGKGDQGPVEEFNKLRAAVKGVGDEAKKLPDITQQLGATDKIEEFRKLIAAGQIDAARTLKEQLAKSSDTQPQNKRLLQDPIFRQVRDIDDVLTEFFTKVDKVKVESEKAIRSLATSLSGDNPFAKILIEGANRVTDFSDKLRELPAQFREMGQSLLSEFREINKQVIELDIFKADLASQSRLQDLALRGEQVKAQRREGLDSIKAQKDELLKELETRRGEGTLDFRTQFALLDKISALGRLSPVDQKAIEIAERAIQQSTAALSQFDPKSASGRSAQATQIDFALNAINRIDPTKLTSDLFDIQQRLFEQRAELELQLKQDAQAAVKEQTELINRLLQTLERGVQSTIVIDNRVPDIARAERLGLAPGTGL